MASFDTSIFYGSFLEVLFGEPDVVGQANMFFAGIVDDPEYLFALELPDDDSSSVAVFLLRQDVVDVLDCIADTLPIYGAATDPLLPHLVEEFRQAVQRADDTWTRECIGEESGTGSFDDRSLHFGLTIYNRSLLPSDKDYLVFMTDPNEDTEASYRFGMELWTMKRNRQQRLLRNWLKIARASKRIREAMIEWGCKPGGTIARLAARRFSLAAVV